MIKKKSSLSSFSSMMDGILARHGIAKQVAAAVIVKDADELLVEILPPNAREDIKVISYKNGEMTLACRHTVAMYDAEGVGPGLARKIEEKHPDVTVRVIARLKPEAFREE